MRRPPRYPPPRLPDERRGKAGARPSVRVLRFSASLGASGSSRSRRDDEGATHRSAGFARCSGRYPRSRSSRRSNAEIDDHHAPPKGPGRYFRGPLCQCGPSRKWIGPQARVEWPGQAAGKLLNSNSECEQKSNPLVFLRRGGTPTPAARSRLRTGAAAVPGSRPRACRVRHGSLPASGYRPRDCPRGRTAVGVGVRRRGGGQLGSPTSGNCRAARRFLEVVDQFRLPRRRARSMNWPPSS